METENVRRKKKRGRLSVEEMEYLDNNFGVKSAEELAKEINKEAIAVKNYYQKKKELKISATGEVVPVGLRESTHWQQLKQEFNKQELDMFEIRYNQLMEQFKNDVLATEYSQILLAIRYEIFMHRNARDHKRAINEIDRMQKLLDSTCRGIDMDSITDDQRKFIADLQTHIASARQAEISRTTEYTKLEAQYSKLLQALKATREQRIKNIENSKMTFIDLIKALEEEEMQMEQAKEIAIHNMAAEREYERMSDYHKFVDNQMDKILLNEDTVVDKGVES